MIQENKYSVTGPGIVELKKSTKVGAGVQFIFNKSGTITLGDYCVLGTNVKIICSGGDVFIDDWTSIHDNCLILSGDYVSIGQHCWFGQNTIIDGSGGLKIGHGVRVGMYSQIWSHVAAGEQIEGCTLFGQRPVEIMDDVWLVGSCIVASGVSIGRKTIALIGSNITKSVPANVVIAGAPAKIKEGINFYKDISLDEKWALIKKWINEIKCEFDLLIDDSNCDLLYLSSKKYAGSVVFAINEESIQNASLPNDSTVCFIEGKMYTKRLTDLEYCVLKSLSGNKARFICK